MNLEDSKIIQNTITKGNLQEKQEKQTLKHCIAVLVSWETAEGDNSQVCKYSVFCPRTLDLRGLKQLDLRALQGTFSVVMVYVYIMHKDQPCPVWPFHDLFIPSSLLRLLTKITCIHLGRHRHVSRPGSKVTLVPVFHVPTPRCSAVSR